MDELDAFALSCGHYAREFLVCRPHYRGQGYCGTGCRDDEQAAIRRRTNAHHQRTAEGRGDHAAHQRALVARKRVESWAATDVRGQEVASRARCSTPDDAPLPVTRTSSAAFVGEDIHDVSGGHHLVRTEHARTRALQLRWAAARDLAAALVRAARAGAARTPRGAGTGARREPPRCVVCRRAGSRVLPGPARRHTRGLRRCRGP